MKYKIFAVLLICIGCAAILFELYRIANGSLQRINDFTRIIMPHAVSFDRSRDIQYNSWYVAGITGTQVYLGNYTSINQVMKVDIQKKDTHYLNIQIPDKLQIQSADLVIDSPYLYLSDRIGHQILRGNLSTMDLSIHLRNASIFTDAIPINNHSIIFKSLDRFSRHFVFEKKSMVDSIATCLSPIAGAQVDSIFSLDGKLSYDIGTQRLTYVYYYLHEYLCIDTNLTVRSRVRTIDSSSAVHINIASINSGKSRVLASPSLLANLSATISGNYLFVNTSLRAKNENTAYFDKTVVIDVYDILKSKYLFSFYIWKKEDQKLLDFRVKGSTLVAIFDHFLFTYQLNRSYFPNLPFQ